VSKHDVQQVHLTYRGRSFHFVSYEGYPENRKTNQAATDPAWFLINVGKRWPVMPYLPGQQDDERDRLFTAWLESHVFSPTV
jgi:hypothetical protein